MTSPTTASSADTAFLLLSAQASHHRFLRPKVQVLLAAMVSEYKQCFDIESVLLKAWFYAILGK